MILRKQITKRLKDREYSSYMLSISSLIVQELNWKEGEEVKKEIKDGKLILYQESETDNI